LIDLSLRKQLPKLDCLKLSENFIYRVLKRTMIFAPISIACNFHNNIFKFYHCTSIESLVHSKESSLSNFLYLLYFKRYRFFWKTLLFFNFLLARSHCALYRANFASDYYTLWKACLCSVTTIVPKCCDVQWRTYNHLYVYALWVSHNFFVLESTRP